MAVCFQLLAKESDTPVKFVAVDDAICAHFNVEPDAKLFFLDWYDRIGFAIACGCPQDTILELCEGKLREVAEFIFANYRPVCWRD